MSKFNSNNIDSKPSKFITTYLVSMPVYGANIVTTSATDNYYHIGYDKTDDAVIYHNSAYPTPNFKVTDIYFLPLVHDNITNVTDNSFNSKGVSKLMGNSGLPNLIGEFVVKLKNGSVDNPLYLCYLVQSVNRGKGTDDSGGQSTGALSSIYKTIINDGTPGAIKYYSKSNSSSITVSPGADGSIPSQDGAGAIVYKDADVTSSNDTTTTTKDYYVCVFLNPITVSNPQLVNFFNSFTSTDKLMFTKYPAGNVTETILTGTNSASSNSKDAATTAAAAAIGIGTGGEGEGPDSQIYIDCSPTGVGEETIASYNVPINSTLMQDIQKSSLAQLCSNFILFSIILAAAFAGIPILYRMAAIEKKGMNDAERMEMKRFSKPFSILVMIVASVILFWQGQTTNNMYELMGGFLLVFLSILTYILLSTEEAKLNVVSGGFFDFAFVGFIFSVIGRLFKHSGTIFALWLLLFIILLLFTLVFKKKDGEPGISFPGEFLTILFIVGFFVIPMVVGFITWVT